jgi:hypothetical protein
VATVAVAGASHGSYGFAARRADRQVRWSDWEADRKARWSAWRASRRAARGSYGTVAVAAGGSYGATATIVSGVGWNDEATAQACVNCAAAK